MTLIRKTFALGAGLASAAYATYAAATWLRFGRYGRALEPDADTLLDALMHDFDVRDRQQITVVAPADVTLAAALELELDGSPLVRAIFRGRELLLRSKPDATPRPKGLLAGMLALGWGVLAEEPGREIVMGGVTKPWEPSPVFHALPPAEFAAFAAPGYVKIAWTLRAVPDPMGGSTFHTETRAIATDAFARAKFRVYWALLSPGIILIRTTLLPALKAAAEQAWAEATQRAAS